MRKRWLTGKGMAAPETMRTLPLCGLVLVALAFLISPLAAEPVQLRISLQLPISSHLGVNLVQFKQKVEQSTGQALHIEIIDNARAYDDQQVAPAVASGAIEMGVANLTQFVNAVPAVDVLQQPFLFNSEVLVRAAADPHRPMRKLIDEAVLHATGVRILWWQSYGSTMLLSKGRDALLPAEIRGKKVRVFGQTLADFVRACGATPIIIAATEYYEAMKTGKIDYIMTGITGVSSRKLWEVADTITRTEHAAIELVVMINERVWQSLSPAHQKAITEAALEAERELRDRTRQIEEEAYQFARDKGMKIREMTPDQVAEWRACSAPVMDAFMSDTGELGSELMKIYGHLRKDPCCSVAATGDFTRH